MIDFIKSYNSENPSSPIDAIVTCNPQRENGIAGRIAIDDFDGNIIYAENSDISVGLSRTPNQPLHCNISLKDPEKGTWHGISEKYESTYRNRPEVLGLFNSVLSEGDQLTATTYKVPGHKHLWLALEAGDVPEVDEHYRGYLMVEPKDFAEISHRLIEIGKRRAQSPEGKYLECKILVGFDTVPADTKEDRRKFNRSPVSNSRLGHYSNLPATDPRIVIYGHSAEVVQEVLDELYATGWDEFERNRVNEFGNRAASTPGRPGTTFYKPPGSTDFIRSINYNPHVGTSEDVIRRAGELNLPWRQIYPDRPNTVMFNG